MMTSSQETMIISLNYKYGAYVNTLFVLELLNIIFANTKI